MNTNNLNAVMEFKKAYMQLRALHEKGLRGGHIANWERHFNLVLAVAALRQELSLAEVERIEAEVDGYFEQVA